MYFRENISGGEGAEEERERVLSRLHAGAEPIAEPDPRTVGS